MAAVTRDDFMKMVDFQGPKIIKSKADITIGASSKEDCINVYFRNGVKDFFGTHVKVGIYKDRMIFCEADNRTGFKISGPAKNAAVTNNYRKLYGHCVVPISADKIAEYKEWIGDYDLKVDDFYDYYYIQKKG